jgi:nucleoside-diphosphate-sugar epimerase
MTRSILVTGAAGFLGRAFAQHHLGLGDDVLGVDDLSSEHAFWPRDLADASRVQLDAAQFMHETDRSFDVVYHFAAPVGGRLKIEGDPLFNADSLRLDSVLFRWAINKAGTVLFPSSSAVYGVAFQGGTGQLLDEHLFHPRDLTWPAPDEMYGFTKLVGERLAYTAEKYGLNTLCIRPFSGYGEGQSLEYPVPSIAQRIVRREDPVVIWGSGSQSRDFVHADDLVAATVARIDAGVKGYQSMNIASGKPTTFNEVARVMAQIEGYEPAIVNDASKPEGVHARFGGTTEMSKYYMPRIGLVEGMTRVVEYARANLR